ncbi:hypothetical protein EJ04DRAFT_608285 [Polyplosphaeria fusca]|uniref:Uncharacterized protein n=1 Tax=Polyplosphaeria fusca TaxID=682080 RepID=A0A9P4QRF6_9PLEO|nr:hypothetical protein EJ04DRAFT_608285 [Polyplosphaeria fusca]
MTTPDTPSTPTVSSLYGPGAILCWLCTVLSVIISWTSNSTSRRCDTISNDLIACITLPAIAAAHFLYDLTHMPKPDFVGLDDQSPWQATSSMNASFTICMLFTAFAPFLLSLALHANQKRKFFVTGLVGVFSYTVTLFVLIFAGTGIVPKIDRNIVFLPMIVSVSLCALPILLFFFQALPDRVRPDRLLAAVFEHSGRFLAYCVVYILMFMVLMVHAQKPLYVLPQTGYTMGDLDQGVALSAGVFTLAVCIRETLRAKHPLRRAILAISTRCGGEKIWRRCTIGFAKGYK